MIDFDAAWRHLQQTTKAPDDCQRWNKKAARYDSRDAKNLYAEAFVELARVQPGETVFDMGCGTGTLAAEMASRGHKTIVGDFSSGMLAKLRENMALRGIKVAELDRGNARSGRTKSPAIRCAIRRRGVATHGRLPRASARSLTRVAVVPIRSQGSAPPAQVLHHSAQQPHPRRRG